MGSGGKKKIRQLLKKSLSFINKDLIYGVVRHIIVFMLFCKILINALC